MIINRVFGHNKKTLSVIYALVFGVAGSLQANSDKLELDIKSQSIGAAMLQLGERAAVQIMVPHNLGNRIQSEAIQGAYTLTEALAVMLDGSNLVYELAADDVVMIKEKKSSAERKVTEDTRDVEIEEMIVTATKRETRLQDTAMSISVLGADTIDKRGLISMGDYLSTIPGVTMQDRGANNNSIVIRGVSSDPQAERPATGVYFGEIPVSGMKASSSSGSTDLKMVDIERVEVLKGPQGTLYGADTMGGVVRIIPAAPNLEQVEGKVAAQYSYTGDQGSDNSRVEGVLNVPLIEDTLALRGVLYHIDDSGYIKSIAPTDMGGDNGNLFGKLNTYGGTAQIKDNIGATETNGARLSALWRPVEKLDMTLSHTWQKSDQEGLPEVELKLPGKFEQTRVRFGPGIPVVDFDNGISPESEEGVVDESHLTSLVVDYDLGWGALTSASSWVDREGSVYQDFTYNTTVLAAFGGSHNENDVFTQEIRFSSKFEGPVQLVVGGYYQDAKRDSFGSEAFSGDPEKEADALADSGWTPWGSEVGDNYYYLFHIVEKIEQAALFGEISYDITDQLTATVGVRHFEYDQESYNFQTGWWVNSLTPVKSTPLESDYSDENYKVNLSWKPNDDTLLYAQWAEGFRLGKPQNPKQSYCDVNNNGAYELAAGGEVPIDDVNPDNTENFELGYKASFVDSRISVNAALYHINWEGLPVSVNLAVTGCGSYKVNAGESISEGFELESRLHLTDNLRLDVGASYNEAKLKGNSSIGNDGDELPGSADINYRAGLEYAFDLSGHDAFARIDYAYVGEYDTYINQPDSIPSSGDYTQIHLKAGASFGKAAVDLFVKNLTNADDITWVESYYGKGSAPRAFRLRPRTIGLNFSYRF